MDLETKKKINSVLNVKKNLSEWDAYVRYVAILRGSIQGLSGIDSSLQDRVNYSCCVYMKDQCRLPNGHLLLCFN